MCNRLQLKHPCRDRLLSLRYLALGILHACSEVALFILSICNRKQVLEYAYISVFASPVSACIDDEFGNSSKKRNIEKGVYSRVLSVDWICNGELQRLIYGFRSHKAGIGLAYGPEGLHKRNYVLAGFWRGCAARLHTLSMLK